MSDLLVVHPHLHHRHTGGTTHTVSIIPALRAHVEARGLGMLLPKSIPRVRLLEVLARARREPVVWHAHRNHELLLGVALRLLRRKLRVVFTRHGGYPPSRFTKWIGRWADALITLNRENAGWMQMPSTVIPHGLDLARFKPPPDRQMAWQRLGLGGERGVGVVGRVRPNKGQADFVEAIAPLLPRFPQWRSLLVGLAKGRDASWAKSLQLKTDGRLLLVGEQREVVPWYQGLSILVNPSHGESFGLTLIEGMATGCCVVASRLYHILDLIEDGRTGFIYPPRDVKALREVLEMLLREPRRAEEVGRNAAETARVRFGIEREASAISDIYSRLSGANQRYSNDEHLVAG